MEASCVNWLIGDDSAISTFPWVRTVKRTKTYSNAWGALVVLTDRRRAKSGTGRFRKVDITAQTSSRCIRFDGLLLL